MIKLGYMAGDFNLEVWIWICYIVRGAIDANLSMYHDLLGGMRLFTRGL